MLLPRFVTLASLAPLLATSLIAACGEAASPPAADGARVAIEVAPLQLPGVTDAEYRLTVKNGAGATVWSEVVRSSQYGDGAGSVSYVGPCDASSNDNTVELEIRGLWSGSTALDFVNPTASGPLRRSVTCAPNADRPVDFDITLMRPAQQGFFDVAVSFEDIFCSAKLDCTRADGTSNLLLFDPESGARVPTAVFAVACTAGPGTTTELYFDPVTLDCGAAGSVVVPIDGPEPGNVFTTNPAGPLRQVATYRGVEALTQGTPATSLGKVYFNSAIALDALPPGAACALSTTVSAHDAALPGLATPAGVYPIIRVAIPAFANAQGLACGLNPLDDPDAPEGTGVFSDYTPLDVPHVFAFGVRADGDAVVVYRDGTAPAPLGTPSLLSIAAGHGSVDLSWSAVPTATGYRVERADLAVGPYALVASVPASVLSASDSGLGAGVERFYRVSAVRGATVGTPSAPAATTTLEALTVAADGSSIPLGAELVLTPAGGLAPYTFAHLTGPGSVTDDGRFIAGALAGTATIEVGDAAGATTSVTLEVFIGTPQNVVASADAGALSLAWDAVAGATDYRVEVDLAGTWTLLADAVIGTSAIVSGVPGATDTFRVLARDAAGTTGPASASASGRTPSPCDASPCQNGATCSVGLGGAAECACTAGYEGPTCGASIDDCAANPCGTGGTCSDAHLGYTCACDVHHEFDGTTCVVVDFCDPDPCTNGAVCTQVYEVDPGSGGGGSNPECLGSACGTPKEWPVGYQCTCPAGSYGPTCTPCTAVPGCVGAVTCTSANDSTCSLCANGQSGPSCASDLVLFSAMDSALGIELFATDCGPSGVLAFDIDPGEASFDQSACLADNSGCDFEPEFCFCYTATCAEYPQYCTGSGDPTGFTTLGGLVYFTASDASNGRQLWRTDGVSLMRLTDPSGITHERWSPLAAWQGQIFLAGSVGSVDRVYRWDGTSLVTVASFDGVRVTDLVATSTRLYILMDRDIGGARIDYLDAGGLHTLGFPGATGGTIVHQLRGPVLLGETLYLGVFVTSARLDLARIDPTATSAALTLTAFSGAGFYDRFAVPELGRIFFGGRESGTNAVGLASVDQNSAVTWLGPSAHSLNETSWSFEPDSGTLAFSANQSVGPARMFASDGLSAATLIDPSGDSTSYRGSAAAGGGIYFHAIATNGTQKVKRYDPTSGVLTTVRSGSLTPVAFTALPASGRVLVAEEGGTGQLACIDAATQASTTWVSPGGGWSTFLVESGSGALFYRR